MEVIIVGSGPAAAGAALALTGKPGVKITVVDIGGTLEAGPAEVRARLAGVDVADWAEADRVAISRIPARAPGAAIPEKQIFSSDFPFRDNGQLAGIAGEPGANDHVVSGAYGGFSNTWGAQVMPFSRATFDDWPFGRARLEPHYRTVLEAIPYAAEPDDLDELFPLIGPAGPLPKLAERPTRVLDAYRAHRLPLRRLGVTVGKARLAMAGSDCRLCGLCMTGCPYGVIYSASQTFDHLRQAGQVNYIGGCLVDQVGEDDTGRPFVHATRLATGERLSWSADRVFLGCGAMGTTRLVAHSLGRWGQSIGMAESAQFLVPALSMRPLAGLSQEGEFTLNQFNLIVALDESGRDVAQVHYYPYNDVMWSGLPAALRRQVARPVMRQAFRRLTVGLGYLPSWRSPRLRVRIGAEPEVGALPSMSVGRYDEGDPRFFRSVVARMVRGGPFLDLYPLWPAVKISGAAKSYHYGGSFPHSAIPPDEEHTDLLGRPSRWQHIHLVDASVFPSVPATTFTLTVMANAHRIAREVLEGG